MNWTLCMQTPAGESHKGKIGVADQDPKYAAVPAVRILLSDASRWIDGHINQKFEVNPPLAGDGHWEIHIHKEDQTCPLCSPNS